MAGFLKSVLERRQAPKSSGVFINYRHEDSSGYAGRLARDLTRHFGSDQVFEDVNAIEIGRDFVEEIDKAVSSCAALLVVIGKDWLSCEDEKGGRRLEDPKDWVRLEIITALSRDTLVIPLLVKGAKMPSEEDLPDGMESLARRQAHPLGDGRRWDPDMAELLRTLEQIGLVPLDPEDGRSSSPRNKILAAAASAMAAVFLVWWASTQLGGSADDDNRKVEPKPADIVDTEEPTPQPPPPPPGKSQGPTPSRQVASAQSLLAELSYPVGAADGLLGPATVEAVQDFQRARGLRVTGRVSARLIEHLEEKISELESAQLVFPAARKEAVATRAPPPAQPLIDLNGTWYDDSGNPILIQQAGVNIKVGALNAFGTFEQIGTGTVQGSQLSLRYTNLSQLSGRVEATLAPDGRHLNGYDSQSGSGTWHREHLPQ